MILINFFLHVGYSIVMGVDLGSDSIKIAIGSKEKGVHRIRNYYKKDETPNLFAYVNDSCWSYGEGARSQCLIYPETCIQNERLPLNNKYYFGDSLKGYEITAIALKQTITNVIEKLRLDKSKLKIVIAIPPSLTNREKSYLYSALTIAKIDCVQFITSTYAPIELYVNEQSPLITNSAVIIDIGHEGARVSGFEFSRRKITQKFGLFNDNVGGKQIDENLLKLIVERYTLVLSNPLYEKQYNYKHEYEKNKYLLLTKIRKARETLSTEIEATFEYKNINITITRDDLDKCCSEIKEALTKMINLLKTNYQNLLNSGEVLLIGGCTRITLLQNHIKKLLPGINVVKKTTRMLSVCKGACYFYDSEIQTSIQEHNALISSQVVLQTNKDEFVLFSYDNYENFNPVVKLNNVDSKQVFKIVDKIGFDQEFTKFTIGVPQNKNKIELGFSMNYYLMPIPDEPLLIESNGDQSKLFVNYINVGWELEQKELTNSKRIINDMSQHLNNEFKVEVTSNEIEDFKSFVNNILDSYSSFNPKKISFNALCLSVKSKFNSCLKENDFDCPKSKVDVILENFKSSVAYLKIEGVDEYDNIKFKNARQISLEKLQNLIKTCKVVGAKCDDAENWLNSNIDTAFVVDINRYISILIERAKSAELAKMEEL